MSQFGMRAGPPLGAKLWKMFPLAKFPKAQYADIETEKNVDTTTA